MLAGFLAAAAGVMHWKSELQFSNMVAIAQASPDPHVLNATPIGVQLAGLPVTAVATVVLIGPAALQPTRL